jgi:NAD(P)-dependent dehydrogenase (short-subunit alcohol dehydrogenase family)
MGEVIVVIGAGQIGQAIARRVSAGKHVLLADLHQGNAEAAAGVLANAGFDVGTETVDLSSRECSSPARSPTPSMPINWPSAGTRCG